LIARKYLGLIIFATLDQSFIRSWWWGPWDWGGCLFQGTAKTCETNTTTLLNTTIKVKTVCLSKTISTCHGTSI